MSELKPLPCPAWACQGELVECKQDGENFFIECTECSMRGPVECDPYHAQQSWDWIPRALRWTHEPPKVAGWYWRKETVADRAHVFHFTGNWGDYGDHWESDRVCQLPLNLNGNLWAGPIPAPID